MQLLSFPREDKRNCLSENQRFQCNRICEEYWRIERARESGQDWERGRESLESELLAGKKMGEIERKGECCRDSECEREMEKEKFNQNIKCIHFLVVFVAITLHGVMRWNRYIHVAGCCCCRSQSNSIICSTSLEFDCLSTTSHQPLR